MMCDLIGKISQLIKIKNLHLSVHSLFMALIGHYRLIIESSEQQRMESAFLELGQHLIRSDFLQFLLLLVLSLLPQLVQIHLLRSVLSRPHHALFVQRRLTYINNYLERWQLLHALVLVLKCLQDCLLVTN